MTPGDAVGPRLGGDNAEVQGEAEGAAMTGAEGTPAASLRADTDAAVLALMRVSLAVWQVPASIVAEPDGGWRLHVDGVGDIRVSRAPDGIPFRWMIESGGRQRPASSVAGLLRIVRSSVDPSWRASRARVVSQP